MMALLRKRAYLFFICLLPTLSQAQNLTGIWKGSFKTEMGGSYRLEFQITQDNSNTVTGVSYSYGDNINFYGKATMTGRYALNNLTFEIQETRTVEVRTSGGTCLMNYRFTYSRSGREEFLEGSYVGKTEDRADPSRNGKWGDCGMGTVQLRRVQESDFYVEPFLRNTKPAEDPKPDVTVPPKPTPEKKPVVVPKTTTKPKPATGKPTVSKPAAKTPAQKPAIVRQTPKPKADSVRNVPPAVVEREVAPPKLIIPPTTRNRKNDLIQTLTVNSEEISIRLYDNGEVDDDTISVYLDGKALITNKRLSTVPITLKLKLDPSSPEHVLMMVAENLGRIPPNTSLMIVQDGDRRYTVNITSTEQKNAMVRFRYGKDD